MMFNGMAMPTPGGIALKAEENRVVWMQSALGHAAIAE